MDRKKPKHGKYWSVDHHPNRKKKPFRLRWKSLKSLGITDKAEFKDQYFASQKEATEFASQKVAELQRLGNAAKGLGPSERTEIIREAARLKTRGIDPIAAMEEGAALIQSYGDEGDRLIGTFWNAYSSTAISSNEWGKRHQRAQQKFYEDMEQTFMQQPVKAFISAVSGRGIVEVEIENYRNGNRNAKNTLNGIKSKMRSFLVHISGKVEALQESTIREIFSARHLKVANKGRKEVKNISITPAQALYLIKELSKQRLGPWAVMKIFMGARTLLLQEWKWSVVHWETEQIRIPQHQTKLKKNAIHFPMSDIPNFKEWLLWAWKLNGEPEPNVKICPFSQPTISKRVAKAMNAKKKLFVDDGRKVIRPAKEFRNFMRSGFISYGVEEIGVGKVMKIAEDHHNLDKYLAYDQPIDEDNRILKFFALHPSMIGTNEAPND